MVIHKGNIQVEINFVRKEEVNFVVTIERISLLILTVVSIL